MKSGWTPIRLPPSYTDHCPWCGTALPRRAVVFRGRVVHERCAADENRILRTDPRWSQEEGNRAT